MAFIHTIEALSWGDVGLYLSIPSSGLGGAAVEAAGTPEQKERFLKRFTEGEPKWGAMAITEPGAGSDTSAIKTRAVLDRASNEWVLNGEKIFCTSGWMAGEQSKGFVVVWATVDPAAGRAGIKSFVVEAGTPGFKVAKLEKSSASAPATRPRSSSRTAASRSRISSARPRSDRSRPAKATRAC